MKEVYLSNLLKLKEEEQNLQVKFSFPGFLLPLFVVCPEIKIKKRSCYSKNSKFSNNQHFRVNALNKKKIDLITCYDIYNNLHQ